jgi:hypothetical protein
MNYFAQKILTYAGITLLLGFFIIILPRFGLDAMQGFGWFVAAIIAIAVIIAIDFQRANGNIANFNISNFSLVWKDKSNSLKKESKGNILKKIKLNAAILIILALIIALTNSHVDAYLNTQIKGGILNLTISFIVTIYVAIYAVALFSLIRVIFGIIAYRTKASPDATLNIYKEGIKYLNYFITWENVKSMNYPASFEVSKKAAQVATPLAATNPKRRVFLPSFAAAGSLSSTLRIMDKNDKAYLVEVSDKTGLADALKKIGKESLIA